MKNLVQQLMISLVATLLLGLIVSAAYPLVVWGIAQTVFPAKANGSLIVQHGKVVGSALLTGGHSTSRAQLDSLTVTLLPYMRKQLGEEETCQM